MMLFSTNKKNIKKMFVEKYMLKKIFAEENFSYPPPEK